MGQILVRNLDDDVVLALKAKAADADKSLEQFVREVLAGAARPSKAEVLARMDALRESIKLPPHAPSFEAIMQDVKDEEQRRGLRIVGLPTDDKS